MTTHRCVLHKTKLEEFKAWLDQERIKHRPGKGEYQVLQVQTCKGWQVVYDKMTKEHLTVNQSLLPLVRRFISSKEQPMILNKETHYESVLVGTLRTGSLEGESVAYEVHLIKGERLAAKSLKTGRTFVLGLDKLIELAREAGVDEEQPHDP